MTDLAEGRSDGDQAGIAQDVANAHVLVTGDLLRITGDAVDGRRGWHQAYNVFWLSRMIAGALASNGSIRVATLDQASLGLDLSELGPDPEDDAERWWVTAFSSPLDPRLDHAIRKAVAGKVVVSFELPPNLRDVMEQEARAVLDLQIAPTRFLNDLLLTADTCHEGLMRAVRAAELGEREFYWYAGLLQAEMNAGKDEGVCTLGRCALLVTQTSVDRSLINGGRLNSLADYREDLLRLASRYDRVLLSPHPHVLGEISGLRQLLDIGNLTLTTANSYRIMASGVVDRVISISSSLLNEARYFGLEAERLGPARRGSPTIRAGALAGGIAEKIAQLAGFHLGAPRPGLSDEPLLRRLIGLGWGVSRIRAAEPIVPALTLHAQQRRLDANDPAFDQALTYGWHGREDWGVWAMPLSVLTFSFADEAGPAGPLCVIELVCIGPEKARQVVAIWSRGRQIADAVLQPGGSTKIAVRLDRSTQDDICQIWIVCEQAYRGIDLFPGNTDTRPIGVGLKSLEFIQDASVPDRRFLQDP